MMSYRTDTERRQHSSAIHMLALSSGLSEDSVQQLYENELNTLSSQARIRDFLSVIVIRRLKGKMLELRGGRD